MRESSALGLSPRVRGNLCSASWSLDRKGRRVYPRACGGTFSEAVAPFPLSGLSPRVRGNPRLALNDMPLAGSIPARAGEPLQQNLPTGMIEVYPRACGGTAVPVTICDTTLGLSPRVRGNLVRSRARCYQFIGLSPRVRGNLLLHRDWLTRAAGGGSIPARAGEPSRLVTRRSCSSSQGSIPARAGEPRTGAKPLRGRTVYPRACGGTVGPIIPQPNIMGLSPRVRGNLSDALFFVVAARSIPARAGEPDSLKYSYAMFRVYPRACGGTCPLPTAHGSIPARAGEPPPT